MLNELPIEMHYLVCTAAVWRLTHLVTGEDGPWDLIFKLRIRLGNSVVGRAMDCFYCMSFWIAIPFTVLFATEWLSGIICWLSFSGFASLLEQATSHSIKNNHKSN